uniref:Uncharacterized protein n=1 Tax=Clastoptera arizonana TaxID=38151 RepID=A0A1B6CTY9_9HEMI
MYSSIHESYHTTIHKVLTEITNVCGVDTVKAYKPHWLSVPSSIGIMRRQIGRFLDSIVTGDKNWCFTLPPKSSSNHKNVITQHHRSQRRLTKCSLLGKS